LNTSSDEVAVCNLASINIAAHLCPDGSLDQPRLRETVSVTMRMLDNVIDINFYPVEAAANSNRKHRPVGLGVMGMQDALFEKRIPFDTPEAVAFNDQTLKAIAFAAYGASCDLARERGAYATYHGSKWDRGLLPLDTLNLLERERGLPIATDRTALQPWDELRLRIREYGMRRQRSRSRQRGYCNAPPHGRNGLIRPRAPTFGWLTQTLAPQASCIAKPGNAA
jgi:ribonucleoside-diphosphate reductase alpha chain